MHFTYSCASFHLVYYILVHPYARICYVQASSIKKIARSAAVRIGIGDGVLVHKKYICMSNFVLGLFLYGAYLFFTNMNIFSWGFSAMRAPVDIWILPGRSPSACGAYEKNEFQFDFAQSVAKCIHAARELFYIGNEGIFGALPC